MVQFGQRWWRSWVWLGDSGLRGLGVLAEDAWVGGWAGVEIMRFFAGRALWLPLFFLAWQVLDATSGAHCSTWNICCCDRKTISGLTDICLGAFTLRI